MHDTDTERALASALQELREARAELADETSCVDRLALQLAAVACELAKVSASVVKQRAGETALDALLRERAEAIEAVDALVEALRAVVSACRFNCTRESHCGVCGIALAALPDGVPSTEAV